MVKEGFNEQEARKYMKEKLPHLDYWKRYEELSDNGQFEEFKKQLIKEINDLGKETISPRFIFNYTRNPENGLLRIVQDGETVSLNLKESDFPMNVFQAYTRQNSRTEAELWDEVAER